MGQAGRALMVAGPTASGKSRLAMALAERFGGVVINADSMQVYRELRVVTARPSVADEAVVRHRVYGVLPAAVAGSVAWWRGEALAAMAAAETAGLVPILCGGTGLYLEALVRGIAAVPAPGEAARAEARGLLAAEGAAALHARLAAVDPVTAAGLRPGDGQRVARAWEVWRGTGRGLVAWQREAGAGAPWAFRLVLLEPPRAVLREAVAARFAAMVEGGAVEEVRALLALGLDPALPAMRAHGVPELGGFLRGETTLEAARLAAVAATGRYTKRQATWFRHRAPVDARSTHTIYARYADQAQFPESLWSEIEKFLLRSG